jgi:predicted DNA-binding antitoxin AbrB/MazE fold protein
VRYSCKCYDENKNWRLGATTMTIPAKYENGVFKPLRVVKIKEGTLVDVHVPREEKAKPQSIRELGFSGMWADRDDITDGLSYVNRLRDNPRG